MNIWLTISIIGVLTYGMRLSFILLAQRITLPEGVQRALRFVPVAALTAIVVPDLVLSNGALALTPENPRLIAGIVALAVASLVRNSLVTVLAGMLVLWLLIFGLHLGA